MTSSIQYLRSRPAAWIRITGADSAEFLQSQFSNDLSGATDKLCVYGLWLDRKGRIAADSFVFRIGEEEFIACSYDSPASTIIQKLNGFIVADDVELKDESASMLIFSFWGAGVSGLLANWGFRIPEKGAYVEQGGMYLACGRRSRAEWFDIFLPEDAEDWVLQRVTEKDSAAVLGEADDRYAEVERILCGIPSMPSEAAGGVLPQELGLDADGVSFNKGCYLGQEVMARVKQTGRYTRQLYRVSLDAEPPAPPTPLTLGEDEVGELTSAVREAGNGWIGLALLKKNRIQDNPGPFQLSNNATAQILNEGD